MLSTRVLISHPVEKEISEGRPADVDFEVALVKLDLPEALVRALTLEAKFAGRALGEHITWKLREQTSSLETLSRGRLKEELSSLADFLDGLPSVDVFRQGAKLNGFWHVQLSVDHKHALAWSVVHKLAGVLNSSQLPVELVPGSPPPYLNGGPEFIKWSVRCLHHHLSPARVEGRLRAGLPSEFE